MLSLPAAPCNAQFDDLQGKASGLQLSSSPSEGYKNNRTADWRNSMSQPHSRRPAKCSRAAARAVALVSLALLFGWGTPTHAFSIHEAQNLLDPFPEIPGDPGGLIPVVTADLGLNTASGRFTCLGFGCVDNFDSFRMYVPAGLQITPLRIHGAGLRIGCRAGVRVRERRRDSTPAG